MDRPISDFPIFRKVSLPFPFVDNPSATFCSGTAIITTLLIAFFGTSLAPAQSEEIWKEIGKGPGICLVLYPPSVDSVLRHAEKTQWRYFVVVEDESLESTLLRVARMRRKVDESGIPTERISIQCGRGNRIPLPDHLVDAAIMATVDTSPDLRREALRVLRPGGLLLREDETVEQAPTNPAMDNWTHPYHLPDNNPLSNDRLARAPYLTHYLAGPWYVPFPVVTVTSGEIMYKAYGHVGYKERDWSHVNQLVAYNVYNGIELWKRPLTEGFNIHRNTMIATSRGLLLADNESCKCLHPDTGELIDEITAETIEQAVQQEPGLWKSKTSRIGKVWKWMARDGQVLVAMVGEPEFSDTTLKGTRTEAGWPWKPMTPGYDAREYPWGEGKIVFAIDPRTHRPLWVRTLEHAVDNRAVCMKNHRLYLYAPGESLLCLDTRTGEALFENPHPSLLEAIGRDVPSQTHQRGFSTQVYLRCNEQVLCFAGPQRAHLVVVSAVTGELLWTYEKSGNFELVLRDGLIYAMSRTQPAEKSLIFREASGEVVGEIPFLRGNCTRATGSVDAIFTRGQEHGGTMRLSIPELEVQRIALMRPPCMDGVLPTNGLLIWGPWMCDCNLSLIGHISLAPAGKFDFEAASHPSEEALQRRIFRWEPPAEAEALLPTGSAESLNWSTYRSDNQRSGYLAVEVPAKEKAPPKTWTFTEKKSVDLTPATVYGEFAYVGGSDGIVRAMHLEDGEIEWKLRTGGPILYPPSIENERLFVGSGDGWIYAVEAEWGRPLWQFRAAPVDRFLPVHGNLQSTWPVASGVLVENGRLYAAAGIANHDGTHVYCLDTASGKVHWHNGTSGNLESPNQVLEATQNLGVGVSVQGHLLLHDEKLYLAGGNVASPAVYEIENGECLNEKPEEWSAKSPRGRELHLIGDRVVAFDRLLYSPKRYWTGRYFSRNRKKQVHHGPVRIEASWGNLYRLSEKQEGDGAGKATWLLRGMSQIQAIALAKNALLVAGEIYSPETADAMVMARSAANAKRVESPDTTSGRWESGRDSCFLAAVDVETGRPLWKVPLPDRAVPWGIALGPAGQILVTLENGNILCFNR